MAESEFYDSEKDRQSQDGASDDSFNKDQPLPGENGSNSLSTATSSDSIIALLRQSSFSSVIVLIVIVVILVVLAVAYLFYRRLNRKKKPKAPSIIMLPTLGTQYELQSITSRKNSMASQFTIGTLPELEEQSYYTNDFKHNQNGHRGAVDSHTVGPHQQARELESQLSEPLLGFQSDFNGVFIRKGPGHREEAAAQRRLSPDRGAATTMLPSSDDSGGEKHLSSGSSGPAGAWSGSERSWGGAAPLCQAESLGSFRSSMGPRQSLYSLAGRSNRQAEAAQRPASDFLESNPPALPAKARLASAVSESVVNRNTLAPARGSSLNQARSDTHLLNAPPIPPKQKPLLPPKQKKSQELLNELQVSPIAEAPEMKLSLEQGEDYDFPTGKTTNAERHQYEDYDLPPEKTTNAESHQYEDYDDPTHSFNLTIEEDEDYDIPAHNY